MSHTAESSSLSASAPGSDVKNVVIIGASTAGHKLSNALMSTLPTTHRIIVIDASGFAYWPIAGLRAAVQPGWEKKVTIPLSTEAFFPAGTAHRVIAPNKVIELKKNSIVLEKPFEGSNELSFDKCVLATGALQAAPMRAELGSTESDMQAKLVKMQTELAQAKKVVVIGGGPAGLEFAGELRERFPEIGITIVHDQTRVLNPTPNPNPTQEKASWASPPSHPKLSTALEAELKALKIDLILGDRINIPTKDQAAEGEWDGSSGLINGGITTLKLRSGKTVEADYVFVSIGNKSGAGLVEKADKGAIDGSMVRVDDYLRVKSSTPGSIFEENYYAIGDVCNAPGFKTSQTAGADGAYAAISILAAIKGTTPKKFQRSTIHALMVPLGSSRGAGAITVPLFGTFMAPKMVLGFKSKDLFIEREFNGTFQGPGARKVVL